MGTKQLHHVERMVLQGCIEKGMSLNETAKRMHCNRSTIYREIHRNSIVKPAKISCGYCGRFRICTLKKGNPECSEFVDLKCERTISFPYVCNGCKRKGPCKYEKRYYDYIEANENIRNTRREHHLCISINEKQLTLLNKIFSKGIRLGQSIHHIYVSNPVTNFISERTIRRYLYNNLFEVKAHELPRFVRFNHNTSYRSRPNRVKSLRNLVGRTYQDYLEYRNNHKDSFVVQLDSVIGRRLDKQALLTIHFPSTHFMFGIVLPKANPTMVNRALLKLREIIGIEMWKKVFGVILTDNGVEFERLVELEVDENGEQVTKVFYCDPYSSFQKGECERNHEFIRYVFAKGNSLDYLTQEKANLMFSHINSYVRGSLEEKTPYELTKESLGSAFLRNIGITEIKKTDVTLKGSFYK